MAVSSPRATTSTNVLSPSSNSPHSKALLTRQTFRKAGRLEQDLGLKLVIGTTTTSSNAFDALPESRCIGYLAGAVAVVGKVNDDGSISQTFFRSKQLLIPNAGGNPLSEISSNPLSPSHTPHARTPVRHRDLPFSPASATSSVHSSLDSPGSKNSSSIVEKVKPLISISFSPSGKLLAVGELGHKPRVLIYSMRYVGQDPLLSTISEHTFGVRFLSFSPDSKLLASLGDVNDGFLYIWNVNDRNGSYSLRASNKCTTAVKHMAWLGKNLVTVGTRHVKVWTVETAITPEAGKRPLADQLSTLSMDSTRTLSGHNCLLGSLLDKTFTAVIAIADVRAVVCSEDGDICLLENEEAKGHLSFVGHAGFPVSTATLLAPSLLLVGGQNGKMKLFGLQRLLVTLGNGETWNHDQGIEVAVGQTTNAIVAMAFLGSDVVVLDNKRTFQTLSCNPSGGFDSQARTIAAHGGTPAGVLAITYPNTLGFVFMTWALDGTVLFWDQAGNLKNQMIVSLNHGEMDASGYTNELRVVRLNDTCVKVFSGDRQGVLRVTEISNSDCVQEVKAHHGDIIDIAVCKIADNWKIITAGRDRMIQIFHWQDDELRLIQTLNDHVGAVTSLLLLQDGRRLLSCSADRNIIIRDFVSKEIGSCTVSAYLKTRSIVLKATPLSMTVNPRNENNLIVSTNDKQVLEYDLTTGNIISAFKAGDTEDNSSVVLSSITHIPSTEGRLVAGISNTDKSIRLYDTSGNLRARDYGHTEGLSSICLVDSSDESERHSLVTTATDGTVYLWQPQVGNLEKTSVTQDPVKEDNSLVNQTPVRRVLSSADLAQLQELRAPSEKSEGGSPSRPASPKRNPSKLSQVQAADATTGALSATPRRMSQVVPPPLLTSMAPQTRTSRSESLARPQSPASPRTQSPMSTTRAKFTDTADRRRKSLSTGSTTTAEPNVILLATEQMCRSLQFFRKKLALSNKDNLPDATSRELEKELEATAKMLLSRRADVCEASQDRSNRATSPITHGIDEERLIALLEARLEAKLLSKIGQSQDAEHVTAGGKAEGFVAPTTT